MTLDQQLKDAFALLDISNFKWLTAKEVKELPPCTKKGSLTVPLNKETFEGMQAASIFTGHWKTQGRTVMKKKRNFRITVRMYQVGIDKYIEANAVMINPDTVHKAWHAIKEAGDFIMGSNESADWDENRCNARVSV